MGGRIAMFGTGLLAPWHGLALIARTRSLIALALAPAAFSAILFALGLRWATLHLNETIGRFVLDVAASPAGAHPWLYFAVLAAAWPAFLALLFFSTFLAVKLLSTPFHTLLAMRALTLFGVPPVRCAQSTSARVRALVLTVSRSLAEEVALLICATGLFALSFVPLVNTLVGCGYLLLVTFDCVGYSLDTTGLTLRQRVAFLRAQLPACAGFALSLAAILLVPGLDLFTYPIAVAGGSWLVSRPGALKGT